MTPSVWDRQADLARRVRAWGLASVATGTALAGVGRRGGKTATQAFGVQTALWGAVDVAIAAVGDRSRIRKLARLPDPGSPAVQRAEARALRRLLLVNAVLDIGYVVLGAALLRRAPRSQRGPVLRGHGAAVVVQGMSLVLFDLGHARGLGPR